MLIKYYFAHFTIGKEKFETQIKFQDFVIFGYFFSLKEKRKNWRYLFFRWKLNGSSIVFWVIDRRAELCKMFSGFTGEAQKYFSLYFSFLCYCWSVYWFFFFFVWNEIIFCVSLKFFLTILWKNLHFNFFKMFVYDQKIFLSVQDLRKQIFKFFSEFSLRLRYNFL